MTCCTPCWAWTAALCTCGGWRARTASRRWRLRWTRRWSPRCRRWWSGCCPSASMWPSFSALWRRGRATSRGWCARRRRPPCAPSCTTGISWLRSWSTSSAPATCPCRRCGSTARSRRPRWRCSRPSLPRLPPNGCEAQSCSTSSTPGRTAWRAAARRAASCSSYCAPVRSRTCACWSAGCARGGWTTPSASSWCSATRT
mmetsp:Transcript_26278/g.67570  ORF Transcript_26278/g.67570 Transcript_26278/m.67570 type:complete len:200 (-) Transcript_26278:1627-2226(-)